MPPASGCSRRPTPRRAAGVVEGERAGRKVGQGRAALGRLDQEVHGRGGIHELRQDLAAGAARRGAAALAGGGQGHQASLADRPTAWATAARSAQMVSPYEAFSTFAPAYTRPLWPLTAAPTRTREYDA